MKAAMQRRSFSLGVFVNSRLISTGPQSGISFSETELVFSLFDSFRDLRLSLATVDGGPLLNVSHNIEDVGILVDHAPRDRFVHWVKREPLPPRRFLGVLRTLSVHSRTATLEVYGGDMIHTASLLMQKLRTTAELQIIRHRFLLKEVRYEKCV
jgi:hypothetical protein